MDWLSAFAGLLVGMVVGVTGVGGGSLMSPILILLFGVAPSTAVGTDLLFAAVTKSVGGFVHHRLGSADMRIVFLLCAGSIPAAGLTVWWLSTTGVHQVKGGVISEALGIVLLLTAIATLFRGPLVRYLTRTRRDDAAGWLRLQPGFTVLAGVVLGTLVTLTSVGAGALGATMLLLLYPFRLTAKRLVGTDILHAVPLTLVAGFGHFLIGNVDFRLLGALLVGSIPGIVIGSLLTARLNDVIVQRTLAVILLFTGYKLIVAAHS